MTSEKRTDLHEGDEVVIHIRGTLEEIVDHGTRDKPLWLAQVQTKRGWMVVKQEDVTPYIEIPEHLRYCSECGREVVWDDPRKTAPTLVCPRCTYDELRKFQRKTETIKRRGRWEYIGNQANVSPCQHRDVYGECPDVPCYNGECPGYVRGECPFCGDGSLKPELKSEFRTVTTFRGPASVVRPRLQTDTACIRCPVCGREQQVPLQEYLYHIERPGHPYTCGNEGCPSHTEMAPVDPVLAAYKEAISHRDPVNKIS